MKSQLQKLSAIIKINCLIIIFSINVFSQTISVVNIVGSICNQKNSSVTVTPDGQSLSVLFQELQLNFPAFATTSRLLPQVTDLVGSDVQGSGWTMIDHHDCLIQLEIKESTERITHIQLMGDARGVAFVPAGFKGSFKVAVDHDTGLKSPAKSRSLIAKQYFENVDEDFSVSFDKKLNMVGSCRPSVKRLTIKVLMGLSKHKSSVGEALLGFDSLDKTLSGLKLGIRTAPCL